MENRKRKNEMQRLLHEAAEKTTRIVEQRTVSCTNTRRLTWTHLFAGKDPNRSKNPVRSSQINLRDSFSGRANYYSLGP